MTKTKIHNSSGILGLRRALTAGFLLLGVYLSGQTEGLTIDSCYAMARKNYPLLKQMALVEKTKEYSIANASKGYLPQVAINGQATYQSDVTSVPISLPNVSVPTISKDQYKLYADINQPLTDVFVINQQKELLRTNSAAEGQRLEVELYKLRERVNELFFGILLIDAQIRQTELLKQDINSGITRVNAAVANGTALKSNADLLNAELLKAEQRRIELKAARRAYADMLGVFIARPVHENTALITPGALPALSQGINRPELKQFDFQKKSAEIQSRLISVRNVPRLNLFLQSGYGRPALNMLSNDFEFYYIGGIRLNWNISGYYTFKRDKQLVTVNQEILEVQRETFLFNIGLALKRQNSEIEKLNELVSTDDRIITLRGQVKTVAATQLENGSITAIDYLSHINAEDQARQNRLIHQVQLLLAQYNYQTTTGN
jgi:outer membrane protein TolC